MNLKTLLIAFFAITFFTFLNAQDGPVLQPCGTQDGKVSWLVDYQKNTQSYPRSADLLFVPIKVHIVGTSGGFGYFGVDRLLDAFCTLNNDFAASDIQFFISGDLNYINNSNFYDHTFSQGVQMMNQNNVANVINCYIVESPAGNCGYSIYSNGIALSKSCMGANAHTWAHEVGHYLSLPHPFYGWEGTNSNYDYLLQAPNWVGGVPVEKTDGSNCQSAADGFCDTPPDYLAYIWQCNADSLSNQLQTDPDSITFRSDGTLIMSYSRDNCSSRFSDGQIAAMRANINFARPYLLDQMDPLDPVGEAVLDPISPFEGETVDFFENVFFEWEPVANATSYCLEISPLPSFALVLFRYHVEGNSFLSTDLKAGKNYYWRIRPYNAQYTCENISGISPFSTGLLSAVQTIDEINNLSLHPNPIGIGREMRVSLDVSEALQLDVELLSLTGQVLQQSRWNVLGGRNQFSLETANLLPGVYLLKLRSEKGAMSRKVIVMNNGE